MAASPTPSVSVSVSVSATTSPTPLEVEPDSQQALPTQPTSDDVAQLPKSEYPVQVEDEGATAPVGTRSDNDAPKADLAVMSHGSAEPTQAEPRRMMNGNEIKAATVATTTTTATATNPATNPASQSHNPALGPVNPIDPSVRNPLPSNLHGRVDGRNGRFAVLQMGLRPDLDERTLAAQRSSETTAAISRAANKDGYRPLKRTRFVPNSLQHNWLPPTLGPPLAPNLHAPGQPAGPSVQAPARSGPVPPAPSSLPAPPAPPSARYGLPPAETKSEQARLLTLLRSLHPLVVVDQLCKAVAYFGGIPSAPAPRDGVFPESALFNGSGALLIGWLAEIYPPLDGREQPQIPAQAALPPLPPTTTATTIDTTTTSGSVNTPPVSVHRGRGRPKGSKSGKYQRRHDRLHASGVSGASSSATRPADNSSAANSMQSQDPTNPIAQAPLTGQGTDSALSTPVRRGRGRPKGSRNKPKALPVAALDGVRLEAGVMGGSSQDAGFDSPLAHKTLDRSSQPNVMHASSAGTSLPAQALHTMPHPTQQVPPSQLPRADGSIPYSPTTNSATQEIEAPATQDSSISRAQAIHSSQQLFESNTAVSPVSSRKRKISPGSQTPNEESQEIAHSSQSLTSTANTMAARAPLSQAQQAQQAQQPKRRRTSIGTGQNVTSSQPWASGTPVSSNVSSNASSKSPGTTRTSIRQPIQQDAQQQQQQLQRQRLSQNASPQQVHQVQASPQVSSQTPTQTSPQTTNWQRNQPARPQQRPQNNRNGQAYFPQQQRPIPNHYGHNGNTGDRYGRNTSTGQFQQAMLNPSPSGLANQQSSRPQHQQPQNQQQQQHQQQQQPASSSQPISQYSGYAGSNYMGVDYSPANFNGQAQLEAALGTPNGRGNVYQSMNNHR
ncbi:hypothetical protein BGZ63DRAFT_402336 [Mariannaea sp. PMI_226]|nr:hypothetical protein BGZ63DRAFT_402336 [Mariannaea sp. PMI_226]